MAPRIDRRTIAVPAVRIGKANSTHPHKKTVKLTKIAATKGNKNVE